MVSSPVSRFSTTVTVAAVLSATVLSGGPSELWAAPASRSSPDPVALGWQRPVVVSGTGATDEQSPQVGIASNGSAVVAWQLLASGEKPEIRMRYQYASGDWSGDHRAFAEAGAADTESWDTLAVADSDADVLAWTHGSTYGDNELMVSSFNPTDGSQWSPSSVDWDASMKYQPSVAINSAGTYVLAYSEGFSGRAGGEVNVLRGSTTRGPGAEHQLWSSSTVTPIFTDAAIDASGHMYVVWTTMRSALWAAVSTDGKAWSKVQLATHSADEPHLAVSPDGTHVAVTYAAGSPRRVMLAEYRSGAWRSPTTVSAAGITSAVQPSLAVDNRHVVVAYVRVDRHGHRIELYIHEDGHAAVRRIVSEGAKEGPAVAAAGGAIHVLWRQCANGTCQMWAADREDGVWRTGQVSSPSATVDSQFSIDMTSDGKTAAVWRQRAVGEWHWHIAYSRFEQHLPTFGVRLSLTTSVAHTGTIVNYTVRVQPTSKAEGRRYAVQARSAGGSSWTTLFSKRLDWTGIGHGTLTSSEPTSVELRVVVEGRRASVYPGTSRIVPLTFVS